MQFVVQNPAGYTGYPEQFAYNGVQPHIQIVDLNQLAQLGSLQNLQADFSLMNMASATTEETQLGNFFGGVGKSFGAARFDAKKLGICAANAGAEIGLMYAAFAQLWAGIGLNSQAVINTIFLNLIGMVRLVVPLFKNCAGAFTDRFDGGDLDKAAHISKFGVAKAVAIDIVHGFSITKNLKAAAAFFKAGDHETAGQTFGQVLKAVLMVK